MGFFKWFKKKKENAPVENTQANEVEVSVTEESNVEETQAVEENKNEDVVEAVVSTDDEVEVVEESVDETETIAEEVSEIEEIEDTVEKEEVDVENTVEEIKEEEQAVVEEVKEVENAVEKVENEVEENHTESTTEGIVEEVTKENDTTVEEVEIKEITTEENNVVEKTEVEEAVQEIPEENVEPVEVEETEEVAVEEQPTEEEKPKGFFAKIKAGLSKTRNNIISSVENVLSAFTKIDEDLYEELEEALIMADIGVETSTYIIEKLRDNVKHKHITDGNLVKEELKSIISEILSTLDTTVDTSTTPSVILVIGVNGVGKTTSIGKIASHYKSMGKKVLLAAADTFRAAAIDQLDIWAQRSGCDIIKHQENSDPAAVVFDACTAAKARGADILICDTAGRLHNKKNLMAELAKINRVIERELPDSARETLLVLDATTGQNAVSQAKLFSEAADITGIILTKLDGTAKGGIVISIAKEQNVPVKFVGVGEGIDDLQEFNSDDFAKAIFEE